MDRTAYVHPILSALLQRDADELRERLVGLIQQNGMMGNPSHGFLFGGEFHTIYQSQQISNFPKKLLHEDLHEDGHAYLTDKKSHQNELQKARQGLMAVLFPCKTAQDVRDILTDPIAKQHPELKDLPRTRPPGWAFEGRPFQQHLFKETMDILEFHYSNQIF